jgi:hypothetical protein
MLIPIFQKITCHNKAYTNQADNELDETRVKANVAHAPATEVGHRSGYPHIFTNFQHFNFGPAEKNADGSPKTLLEIPVFPNGADYQYEKKPKPSPGGFRAIYTRDDKVYLGVISHTGIAAAPEMKNKKGKITQMKVDANPAVGDFHLCS